LTTPPLENEYVWPPKRTLQGVAAAHAEPIDNVVELTWLTRKSPSWLASTAPPLPPLSRDHVFAATQP
jgi:hypothetical protein